MLKIGLIWCAVLLASYLLGAVPTAYLVVKWRTGQDIRQLGSGNVGSTNAIRAVGPLGYLVFVFDTLKGLLPTWIGLLVGGFPLAAAAGFVAVLGHFYPVWLGFRGGKGVATAFGCYLALTPVLGLCGIGVWFVLTVLLGYVSAASCAAVMLGALAALVLGLPYPIFWLYLMLGLLVIVRHRSNYHRICQGRERRSKYYYRTWLKRKG